MNLVLLFEKYIKQFESVVVDVFGGNVLFLFRSYFVIENEINFKNRNRKWINFKN